jgi:hypothetical protein
MTCLFTPIAARSISVAHALVTFNRSIRAVVWCDMNVSLPHRPGEGVLEPS